MRLLRDVFGVVAPDTKIINQAIDAEMGDFEDAIHFHSAVRAKASYLITRDPKHFPKDGMSVVSPEEFLAIWRELAG